MKSRTWWGRILDRFAPTMPEFAHDLSRLDILDGVRIPATVRPEVKEVVNV